MTYRNKIAFSPCLQNPMGALVFILFTSYCECPLGSKKKQYGKHGVWGAGWVSRCLCGEVIVKFID